MRSLLKYITLLIFSGVIIPMYKHTFAAKTAQSIRIVKTLAISKQTLPDGDIHFSFLKDVAAKLLPVANFLK